MSTLSSVKHRGLLYIVAGGVFVLLLGYVLDFQESVMFSWGSFLSCFGGHVASIPQEKQVSIELISPVSHLQAE